ncbi:MAG: hypothetical protein P9L99_10655 [Candidatus Lernaella stagnicola]|nr:hypothetical protein [Candidatus Lernaella stagnicola]
MRRGKILRIKWGVNPNSSSIGTDVSLLLFSAAAVTVLVNVLDAALRLWLKRRRTDDAASN